LITDLVKRETAIIQQQKKERSTTSKSKSPNKKLLTPAMAASTAAFTQHRGKLPWPVKTGFISNKFGIQPHAVLRNIQVENLGIDIQTQEESIVHAIFGGIVKTIAFVPGMNQVVIIQHGKYHTVYAKLKSTSVNEGQHVESQGPIGVVYTHKNGLTELQLQIWKGIQKLNPAGWLSKQPTG
jgi:septal ring factor EnvC (AmiA/AmiB activator)